MRPSGWWWGEGWGWGAGAGAGGGGSGQCRQLTGEAVDRWSLWSVGGFGAAAVCDQTDWQMVSYVSLLRLPSPLQMCLCFGPWLCPDVEESSGSWAQMLLRNAGTPWCCSRTTWVWPGQGSALFGTMWLWQVQQGEKEVTENETSAAGDVECRTDRRLCVFHMQLFLVQQDLLPKHPRRRWCCPKTLCKVRRNKHEETLMNNITGEHQEPETEGRTWPLACTLKLHS